MVLNGISSSIMVEKAHILIVEDEAILGMDITSRLEAMGYSVTLCDNPEKALNILKTQKPDLLILDIKLGDSHVDGIDLAHQIKKLYDIPFIFLTSHSDDSVIERAKKTQPAAYILKPFNDKNIRIAIEITLSNHSGTTTENEQAAMTIKDSLFLRKGNHFERVKLSQILWLQADSNYTEIHTTAGTYIYSTVMKKIEGTLPAEQFFRIHRSYIVNKESISGFEGNTLLVNNKSIPVSKQYRPLVFKWFNVI